MNSSCIPINSEGLPSFERGDMEGYTNKLLEYLWEQWVKIFFKDSSDNIHVVHEAETEETKIQPFVYYKTTDKARYILDHTKEVDNTLKEFFYIPYSSSDDIGRLINQTDRHRCFGWEIAEMVYSRVLIIDERIYDSKDICRGNESIETIWKRQGVDIIDHTHIIVSLGAILEKLRDNGPQYHFLIIHQGIIDKIIEKHSKERFDSIWRGIKANVPFPVVVSGRGKPETVREGKGRWLQFSDLEQHILQCADSPDAKHHLIQVLFALREEKEEKW